jgi:hypothetical protein
MNCELNQCVSHIAPDGTASPASGQRHGLRYASDTADAEWAVIEPHRAAASAPRADARDEPGGCRRFHFLNGLIGLPMASATQGFPAVYAAEKKIKGRKRHILTDTIGRRVGMIVHPANVQDRDGAPDLLASVRNAFPWLRHVFADGGYASVKLMSRASGGRLNAIMEPNPHAKLELWRCWSDSRQTLIRSRARRRERAPRIPPRPTAMRPS